MKCLFTVAMLAAFAAVPADAQFRPQLRAKAKQGIVEQQKAKQKAKQQKQADAIERFLAMSPEERKQALAELPPTRQRQILQRLATLELLSDEERALLRGRLQVFSGMPVDRRQAVREELRTLRGMSSREDRRRRLGSDEVKQNFSEEERQLLYDVFGQREKQEE